MPPKKAKPEFRVNYEKAHFTYPTHINEDAAFALFKSFGELKMISFVHEEGDEHEDAGYPADHVGPYEHTHVFVWWKKKLDITNSRAFDLTRPANVEGVDCEGVSAVCTPISRTSVV